MIDNTPSLQSLDSVMKPYSSFVFTALGLTTSYIQIGLELFKFLQAANDFHIEVLPQPAGPNNITE